MSMTLSLLWSSASLRAPWINCLGLRDEIRWTSSIPPSINPSSSNESSPLPSLSMRSNIFFKRILSWTTQSRPSTPWCPPKTMSFGGHSQVTCHCACRSPALRPSSGRPAPAPPRTDPQLLQPDLVAQRATSRIFAKGRGKLSGESWERKREREREPERERERERETQGARERERDRGRKGEKAKEQERGKIDADKQRQTEREKQ